VIPRGLPRGRSFYLKNGPGIGRGISIARSHAPDFSPPGRNVDYNLPHSNPPQAFHPWNGILETFLGRVIHTTNPTRQRNQTLKKMASAIQDYSTSGKTDQDTPALSAFLLSGLQEIRDSIDRSADAWEKRNYWIKADAFRRQWSWIEKYLAGMKESLQSGSWTDLRKQINELEQRIISSGKAR